MVLYLEPPNPGDKWDLLAFTAERVWCDKFECDLLGPYLGSHLKAVVLPLLLVCKAFCREVMQIFWGENWFECSKPCFLTSLINGRGTRPPWLKQLVLREVNLAETRTPNSPLSSLIGLQMDMASSGLTLRKLLLATQRLSDNFTGVEGRKERIKLSMTELGCMSDTLLVLHEGLPYLEELVVCPILRSRKSIEHFKTLASSDKWNRLRFRVSFRYFLDCPMLAKEYRIKYKNSTCTEMPIVEDISMAGHFKGGQSGKLACGCPVEYFESNPKLVEDHDKDAENIDSDVGLMTYGSRHRRILYPL